MAEPGKKKPSLWQKLRNKYRLVVLNDETFEEKASFKLTRFNLYSLVAALLILNFAIVLLLVAFTPLKRYIIPGYGDDEFKQMTLEHAAMMEELERKAEIYDLWVSNILNKLNHNIDTSAYYDVSGGANPYDSIDLDYVPPEDLALREQIENEMRFQVNAGYSGVPVIEKESVPLEQLDMMAPLRGLNIYVTSGFDLEKEHFGLDIVAPKESAVKAIMDGTVISSGFSNETGHVLVLQHDHNLVSMYKHNSSLLKKVGNFVKAGDAIAIIGNSGENQNGPHLHFELWHEGQPVDPQHYINF